MKTNDKNYAAVAVLMQDDFFIKDESLTFNEICSKVGADPLKMDALFNLELGYSGDELLALFRGRLNK